MDAIQRAVEIVGTQTELARRIGATQGQVSHWVVGFKPVPPNRCIPIEKATEGQVTRYELRPDIFGERPDVAA